MESDVATSIGTMVFFSGCPGRHFQRAGVRKEYRFRICLNRLLVLRLELLFGWCSYIISMARCFSGCRSMPVAETQTSSFTKDGAPGCALRVCH